MEDDVHNPFGYASPQRSPNQQLACSSAMEDTGVCATPPPSSPGDGEGTPKVPLLPFGGRPGRSCPGAPRKGRAPNSYDVSGDAPVRRLSFGAVNRDTCVSPEPSGDMAVDSMDQDDPVDPPAQQMQVPRQELQQQHNPAAAAAAAAAAEQPSHLHIPRLTSNQEQLLLSPSPPPVQQQLWLSQQQQQHQQQRPSGVQQQLFVPSQNSSWHARNQPVWPCQDHQQQQQQPQSLLQQPYHQQPHQQLLWPNPLSPAGVVRPPTSQGSTTPARLFR